MKTIKGIVVLSSALLNLFLAGCSLDEGGEPLVANQARITRGSSTAPNGGLAIDLPIQRPSSLFRLRPDIYGVEAFLSLSARRNVQIPDSMISTIEIFFWGEFRSKSSNRLVLGNSSQERAYFQNLDVDNFQFEVQIWDDYTGARDRNTGKVYDYLGYAYFGRHSGNKVGALTGVIYNTNSTNPVISLRFSDSLGNVYLEADLNRSTRKLNNGVIIFDSGSGTEVLGTFENVNACSMFNCA